MIRKDLIDAMTKVSEALGAPVCCLKRGLTVSVQDDGRVIIDDDTPTAEAGTK